MKRRAVRKRDEASAEEQAEHRTETLLAQLRAREAAAREHLVEGSSASVSDLREGEPQPPADEST